MTACECPTRDQLAAFAAGMLPWAATEGIARHIEGRPACAAALAEWDAAAEPLVAPLRIPAPDLPGAGRLPAGA